MNFHWPHFLWLLAVPAALLWAVRRKMVRPGGQGRPLIVRAWASHTHVEAQADKGAPGRRERLLWRFWLALALGIIALARPQWGPNEDPVRDQSREILVALDLSRSMLTEDIRPSRLARAKLLLASLLDQLEGDRVGLVVFSGTAFLQTPLSGDYEILREFLPALDPAYLPEDGTDFDRLLETAVDSFGAGDADRYLVVLSDGEAQAGNWRHRIPALRAKGVRVVALGLGTPTGGRIPIGTGEFVKDAKGEVVISQLRSATLQELARETDGTYRDAGRWIDLPHILKGTWERKRAGLARSSSSEKRGERFQWFLAPALLLALWGGWREFPLYPRTRPRPPLAAPAPEPRVIAVAVVLIGAMLLAGHPSRSAEEDGAKKIEHALVDLLQRVIAQPAPRAQDYADLVRHYIGYGQKIRRTQGTVPPEIIRDAGLCVSAGRALEPRAVDWEMLLRELRALARTSDDALPPDPNGDPDQNDPDKSGGRSVTKEGPPKPAADDAVAPAEKEGRPGQGEKKESEAASPKAQEAFGELNPNGVPASTEPAADSGRENEDPRVKQLNPDLVIPLHKLDELRRTDSPVELFLLMQGRPSRPPSSNRHTW